MKPAPKTGGVVTLVLILAILGIGAAILLRLGYGGRGGYSSVTRYAPLGIGR